MFVHFKKPFAAVAVTCSLIIAGCGGSGSSESETIDAADITWTEGVLVSIERNYIKICLLLNSLQSYA